MERSSRQEKLAKSLEACERRLAKLKQGEKGRDLEGELGQMESELRACRVELGELEERDEDWLDTSYAIERRLENLQRNLQMAAGSLDDNLL